MKHATAVFLIGIAMAGCAGTATDKQHARSTDPQWVVGKTWQWESTVTPAKKTSVAAPERYTVLLADDGKARVRFDCNRGGGSYTISAGKLSFGPLMSTRMACPPDSLDGPFMRDLQRVAAFFVQEESLFLEMPDDSGTMRFRSSADAIVLQGTVVKKDLEGGFFAIDGDDGKTYEPINLPDSFRKNGLRVTATVRIRNDVAGIHMTGDIVEIVDIAVR